MGVGDIGLEFFVLWELEYDCVGQDVQDDFGGDIDYEKVDVVIIFIFEDDLVDKWIDDFWGENDECVYYVLN